jgi:Ca2+-binding EF-hand superfamily protein
MWRGMFRHGARTHAWAMQNPINAEKAKELVQAMDVDRDGTISFNEFLEAFRLSM